MFYSKLLVYQRVKSLRIRPIKNGKFPWKICKAFINDGFSIAMFDYQDYQRVFCQNLSSPEWLPRHGAKEFWHDLLTAASEGRSKRAREHLGSL